MHGRTLSELECFVLGLVWQLGPCSPYMVRRHMQESPSTQWSASAGAIYPLMRRLEKRGLLSARSERTGKRRRREYRATERGESALRAWIGPPLAPEAITVAHDPLRARARFLALLSPGERSAWIKAAREALDEVERRVLAWHEEHRDLPAAAVLTASGRIDVESRRKWVEEVERSGKREG